MNQPQLKTNPYPSNLIGHVLQILVGILVVIFTIVMLLTIFYVVDFEFYYTNLSSIDTALATFGVVLNYIVIILYLVWIVRVHIALRNFFPEYPIKPFGAIIRNIPIINLWGFGNLYMTMSEYFYLKSEQLKSIAGRLKLLLPFLYITFFIGQAINRFALRNIETVSDSVIFIGTIFDAAVCIVYLFITLTINRALINIVLKLNRSTYQ